MGSSASRPLTPLIPFHPPIGLHPSYCSPHPVTLVFKTSFSFRGNGLTIKDFASGTDVIKCNRKSFSRRSEKAITDPSGRLLFTIKDILRTRSTTIHAKDASRQLVFTILSKSSSRMRAYFLNVSDGDPVELDLPRDISTEPAKLMFEGQTVAQISDCLPGAKKSSAKVNTFYLYIAPGVDVALIAAIVVCLDEITPSHSSNTGSGGNGLSGTSAGASF